MITEDRLRQIMPKCGDPASWVKPLIETFRRFNIKTEKEIAAFLAQAAVESDSLNKLEENLRYTAQRIAQVWPKQFKSADEAKTFAYNPQKLASRVYANRLGNGSERTGDGYRYCGRGLLQLTGRDNYAMVGKELDTDLLQFPGALLERRYAALSAGAYWKLRVRPNALEFDVEAVTKAITGGDSAIERRRAFYNKALEVFGVGDRSDRDNQSDKGSPVRAARRQKAAPQATTWL